MKSPLSKVPKCLELGFYLARECTVITYLLLLNAPPPQKKKSFSRGGYF